jgi:hypothetical protein
MEVYCLYGAIVGTGKIITKSGISLNAGTLNRGFTVCLYKKGQFFGYTSGYSP